MSTFIDTGKPETVAKSAETNKPIKGAPLAGKIAIITGGGRGMGRSMVLGLAQAGATVIATAARERQELERVVAEAPRAAVLPIVADVTDADNCAELVAETLRRFGKLDILVNNAGRGMRSVSEDFLTEPTRFWETDPKAWRLIIDTNVNGPFFMARAAVPPMIKAGWGRIINHSVNFLTMQRRGFSPYGPSKAALESETQIWAQELAGTGVTVNAILPGGATAAIFILHRRTFYRTVRTKDTAVAGLRAQQRLAVGTFVEELAGIGRHRLALRKTANRTH